MCVDEKSGMQAVERKYSTKSTQPGKAVRVELEYQRHGTLSLILSYDVLIEGIYGRTGRFYHEGELRIILDNLNTHEVLTPK